MKIRTEVIPGAELSIAGDTYVYFGGTSYLGMQTNPRFLEMISKHTRQIGSHWGASRIGNVQLDLYERAENTLATWVGSPACLTLSSGFLAARLMADYFSGKGHACFFGPYCHEALLPPGHSRSRDWDTLIEGVSTCLAASPALNPVVLSDTMGGGSGAGPIWDTLSKLPRECILIADDSHGLGITGEAGSGSWKLLAAMGFHELLLCASLGKAMGVAGGVICGSAERLAALQKTPFFQGASPAPPAGLAALTDALKEGLYLDSFHHLTRSMQALWQRICGLKELQGSPEYPVITFRNPDLAGYLKEHQMVITDFEYAAEGGDPSPSRIVISSVHQPGHLNRLADVLLSFERFE